jgi:hypothetical protein
MHSFLDSATPQRTWNVSLNIGTIKRVKNSSLGIDLVEINQPLRDPDADLGVPPDKDAPPLILQLATDPCLLCDVLYVLCKPDADKIPITDEDFGQSMGGNALRDGQAALFAELTDFFQQLGRTEKANVVSQAERIVKATMGAANQRMMSVDVEGLTDRVVGKLFTDAQASLESTLTNSHSAN